ncbi:2-haloalkanoic acid dehalogenase [Thermogutta terrifontis]|jgi:putative hydrolase of the HAD superfamily|uniref:2-haloalkanoic acid dehalogenase n=1 Tax=Thermogutta terrifontis TaxID=1331910 RepID=A0A286RBY8_9BACT|nr:HAD family hydrolase [Thermogutta terrifontis]ASV73437.1 2-haloalkanoic acid dehalogenase [Thermogutta terrifontis]
MIEAIIFDLDDTLYPEIAFIRSAFATVAEFLADRGIGSPHQILSLLEHIHWEIDRDRVFQHAARRLNFDPGWIPQLVRMVRSHVPKIELPPETREVLVELCRHFRLGIVTDGHREVQRRKLAALDLASMVDVIVCTDELGRPFWKPDPLPFLTACRALKTEPMRVVFVGDHPRRDIWGAARLGMKTVRIVRYDGYFRHHPDLAEAPPDYRITHLSELIDCLDIVPRSSRHERREYLLENAA